MSTRDWTAILVVAVVLIIALCVRLYAEQRAARRCLCVLSLNDWMSGREVKEALEQDFKTSISYGTLYMSLRRLKEEGLVIHRDDDDEDGRFREFKLTNNGLRKKREAMKKEKVEFSLAETT